MDNDDEDNSVAVRVAGALKGAVRLPSFESTVAQLRNEVSRVLGLEDVSSIKLIAGGRTLQDDVRPLREYGVGPTSRVLVTHGGAAAAALGAAQAAHEAEAARAARLERVRGALERIAARDGRGLSSHRELSLENQDGTRLALSETDRRALVTGLALHDMGRASMRKGDLQASLDELLLAEEAFGAVAPGLVEGIDNVALLLLDIVWCCYKLRDVGRLGVSTERLAAARRMLARAHGADQERLRRLHGGFSPEQAIYVRLELLEGVAAFYSGDRDAAAAQLAAAQARWQRLQLCPASLQQLREMGYSQREASRALRFACGDVAAAVALLAEQRQRQQETRAAQQRQRRWQAERRTYGRTSAGNWLDGDVLQSLCDMGYERPVAAEALRQGNNDLQAALDALGNTMQRGALQLAIVARQVHEQQAGPQWVSNRRLQQLLEMGYGERDARLALAECSNNLQDAVEQLQQQRQGGAGTSSADADAEHATGSSRHASSTAEQEASGAGQSRRRDNDDRSQQGQLCALPPTADRSASHGRRSSSSSSDDAEEEVVAALGSARRTDPLAAYDIDVSEDGAAIVAYLARLGGGSSSGNGGGSSG